MLHVYLKQNVVHLDDVKVKLVQEASLWATDNSNEACIS